MFIDKLLICTKQGEITLVVIPEGATVSVGYSVNNWDTHNIDLHEMLHDRLTDLEKAVVQG